MRFAKIYSVFGFLIFMVSCENNNPEQSKYINSIEERRQITNEWMDNDPNSPFNYKGEMEFDGLNYFDIDPEFVFQSKLYPYNRKDTITIFGTKGEERSVIRIGYLAIHNEGNEYKLNVYESSSNDGSKYHSIWFTDKTTHSETYGVGRYLSFELKPDNDHIYTIDFNLAFNPYCAYNANYSCAIPTKEDYLDLAITAGEKKYHE